MSGWFITLFHLASVAIAAGPQRAEAQGVMELPEPAGVRLGVPYARPGCPVALDVSGAIVDKKGGNRIDFDRAEPKVWVTHKVDIDDYEDRCIAEVQIVSDVMHRGCEFELFFVADQWSGKLTLVRARLGADSFCPGWPDSREGEYYWTRELDQPRLLLTPLAVPDRMADRSCMDIEMKFEGDLALRLGGSLRPTRFTLDDFTVTGKVDSVGDVNARCPTRAPEPRAASPTPAKPTGPAGANRFNADFVGVIGMSTGVYSFEQDADLDHGQFRDVDSQNAVVAGGTVQLRYVQEFAGLELSPRLHAASIDLSKTTETIVPSALPLVTVLRVPISQLRPAFRFGGGLGTTSVLTSSEQPVLTGSGDVSSTAERDLNGKSFMWPYLIVGGEVDFHFPGSFYGRIWVDTSLVNASDFGGVEGGLDLSYSFTERMFINAAMASHFRSVRVFRMIDELTPYEVGHVKDQLTDLSVSVGLMY